jgi:hypothetical protein
MISSFCTRRSIGKLYEKPGNSLVGDNAPKLTIRTADGESSTGLVSAWGDDDGGWIEIRLANEGIKTIADRHVVSIFSDFNG